MQVITFLNEKGGVGKTTLATHIAVGLAINGKRVILVDADPQANTTTAMGIGKQPLFHDLVVRHLSWRDAIVSIERGRYCDMSNDGLLMLVPGDAESREVPLQIRKPGIIRSRLQELRELAEYIIIDTSPTPSLLHYSIVLASDYVICPTDCEAFSALDSLVQTLAHVNEIHVQAAERGIDVAKLAGIVPNKYRASTLTHTEVLPHMQKEYGELVWPAIPLAIVFAQSQLERKFLYQFAPESKSTGLLWQMVERIKELA